MRTKIAPDTETHPIAPGRAAPKMVCTAWSDGKNNGLIHRNHAYKFWRRILRDQAVELVNTSMHFDSAVVCATWPELVDYVFAAYKAGRIRCNVVDQRLIDIANGCLGRVGGKRTTYSLEAQMRRHFNVQRDKGVDTWRVRYNVLDPFPVEEWRERGKAYCKANGLPYTDPIDYPIRDASNALMLSDVHDESAHLLRDNHFQAYACFALYLMSCRGIRTDRQKCIALITETKRWLEKSEKLCRKKGLIKPDGKKSITEARKRLVAALPEDTRKRLDAAVAQYKAFNSKKQRDARSELQVKHGLSDKQFRKADRKLSALLLKDIDHAELLRRWKRGGHSHELYRDIRQLVRKPKPFKVLGVPLTKTGQISVKADAAKLSGDRVLRAYATHTSANTLLKKAQRMLRGADIPLQTTYVSPINTGRVSSMQSEAPLVGDNLTNLARNAPVFEGVELPGQRECFVPRRCACHNTYRCPWSFRFCSIDLDAAEMRAYAQEEFDVLGDSELGRTLNAGMNPHRALGADILGLTYSEFERRYKLEGDDKTSPCHMAAQFAKVPNFALLGGGGWAILPDYARGMGIDITDEFARELYEAFHTRWKTVKEMHAYYKKFIHKRYEHKVSRRLRYLDRYAQACNGGFQGRIADAAKHAVCNLAEQMYCSYGVLRGSYAVLFMHDEVLFELVNKYRSEHAWRATKIIIDSVNEYLPDVPMTCKPALSMYMSKSAATVTHPTKKDRDGNPKLLVWKEAA